MHGCCIRNILTFASPVESSFSDSVKEFATNLKIVKRPYSSIIAVNQIPKNISASDVVQRKRSHCQVRRCKRNKVSQKCKPVKIWHAFTASK